MMVILENSEPQYPGGITYTDRNSHKIDAAQKIKAVSAGDVDD